MAHDLEQKLKKKLRNFVASTQVGDYRVDTIRAARHEVFGRIAKHGWQAYIVGGTLRDLMLDRPAKFLPRDIDLVVVGPTQSEMEAVFEDLQVRRTRFGGLHLVKPFEYGSSLATVKRDLIFDEWRLADTWGLRAQGLEPTIRNFVKTPFLNIDSVAIELFPIKGRRTLVEVGFFDSLLTQTLDINYEPNPFPLLCVVRSLVLAVKLNFALSNRLACFV